MVAKKSKHMLYTAPHDAYNTAHITKTTPFSDALNGVLSTFAFSVIFNHLTLTTTDTPLAAFLLFGVCGWLCHRGFNLFGALVKILC